MPDIIKKVVCLALVIILCVTCAAAEDFYASTLYEARMKALDLFDVCALSAEYPGQNYQAGRLIRWSRSIRVYLDGNPSSADREKGLDFLMELGLRVPDLPSITETSSRSGANMIIYFGPLDQLSAHVTDYVAGNWGMFHYDYSDWCIYRAEIGIASDVTTQQERNHLIQEEIVGALGLTNDHYVYKDSILYQPWTTVQQLSEVDWILLNMVYSPLVSPGMKRDKLHKIFIDAWSK